MCYNILLHGKVSGCAYSFIVCLGVSRQNNVLNCTLCGGSWYALLIHGD